MYIRSFHPTEEMFKEVEDIQESAMVAKDNLTDGQKNLKVGDRFITIAEGLIIFNEIIEINEEDSSEELGYIWVDAFSEACRDGEIGSVHRSNAIAKVVSCGFWEAVKSGIKYGGYMPISKLNEFIRLEWIEVII